MEYDSKSIHLSCSVLAATIDGENGIVAIDSTPTIYNYSLEGEYKNHSSLHSFNSYLYRYGNETTISNDGKYALICDPKNDKVLYVDLLLKKLVTAIKITKAPEYASFSDDDTLFLVANSVGRVAIFKTDSDGSLLSEFPIPDSIASAAFSSDCTKVAIASLNKKLFIFNLESNSIESTHQLDDIGEALCFSSDMTQVTLFSRNGSTFIINLKLNKIFHAMPSSQWPTHLIHTNHSNIVLLGTRSAQLFIYTSSKGLCLGEIVLDCWGITSINIHNNHVLIGFSDGTLTIYDVSKSVEEAISYISTGNYEQLSILAATNPLIFVNKELCKKIEEHYKEFFAYTPVSPQERKGYDALASLIVSNHMKRMELLNILVQSSQYTEFIDSFENGDVEFACNAAYEFPLLRQLREFNEIQHTCFHHIAQEILLLESDPQKFQAYQDNSTHNCTKCQHGIIPTPESLQSGYEELKMSVSSNNYPNLMEITEKYPVFRQTRLYKRMMNYGEAMIDKILLFMKSDNMQEALKLATKLALLKPFQKTGQDFKKQIENYEKFKKADETNNFASLFVIATENPALKTTEIFKKHILNYKTLYKQLLTTAKAGEVSKLMTILSPYASVTFFEEKNNELHKLALLSEIEHYAKIGDEGALLEKYHQCFGWDKEYERVCQLFEKEVNLSLKMDEISKECKALITFILGEKVKRTQQHKEDEHEH